MSKQNTLPEYLSLSAMLTQQGIALTAAEMHGLISGMLCGGSQDSAWQAMLYDLTNEGIAYPLALMEQIHRVYNATAQGLDDDSFMFNLLLPEEGKNCVFGRADALAGWVNHFLLGLGVIQPRLSSVTGDVGEVIDDLHNIAQLGYDEHENQEELALALEEVVEYVRVAAMLCHTEFISSPVVAVAKDQPILH